MAAGAVSEYVRGFDLADAALNGITMALLFYIISFYIARYGMYRKDAKSVLSKLYTTGIGAFVMAFLFTWVLIFTYSVYSA